MSKLVKPPKIKFLSTSQAIQALRRSDVGYACQAYLMPDQARLSSKPLDKTFVYLLEALSTSCDIAVIRGDEEMIIVAREKSLVWETIYDQS